MQIDFLRKLKEREYNNTEITLGLLDLFNSKIDSAKKLNGVNIKTKRHGVPVKLLVNTLEEYRDIKKSGIPILIFDDYDLSISFTMHDLDVDLKASKISLKGRFGRKYIYHVKIDMGPEPIRPTEPAEPLIPELKTTFKELNTIDSEIKKYKSEIKKYKSALEKYNGAKKEFEATYKKFEDTAGKIIGKFAPGLSELGFKQE
jgi:hypothetical protein